MNNEPNRYVYLVTSAVRGNAHSNAARAIASAREHLGYNPDEPDHLALRQLRKRGALWMISANGGTRVRVKRVILTPIVKHYRVKRPSNVLSGAALTE